MSLAINVDVVAEVLLPDGKWYKVAKKSFDLDSYEYLHDDHPVLSGGAEKDAGIPATGAIWTAPEGFAIACPLTSVVAVKLVKAKKAG